MFELENVAVRLNRHLALDIDHLALCEAQTVALVGPNGAGKTTLLRLLANLQPATSGRIHRGCTHVAYVAQRQENHRWIPVTVADVMRMGRYRERRLTRRLTRDDHHAIDQAAEALDVAALMSRSFAELSGGESQRVLIAAALTQDASCLLLDEPVTGLDITSQQLILDAMVAERNRGRLVITSTHRLDEAALSDHVLVLATKLIADGPPDEALQPDVLQAAFGNREVASWNQL